MKAVVLVCKMGWTSAVEIALVELCMLEISIAVVVASLTSCSFPSCGGLGTPGSEGPVMGLKAGMLCLRCCPESTGAEVH